MPTGHDTVMTRRHGPFVGTLLSSRVLPFVLSWFVIAAGTVAPLPVLCEQALSAQTSWADRSYRRTTALRWLAAFSELDRQVPTLSPAEQRWLKIEIDDELKASGNRYTMRALAAMDSREYQLRIAKPRLDAIVQDLESLSLSSPQSLRSEARAWAQLVSRFMDQELWQAVQALVKMKVVRSRINGVESLYYENHVLWAKQVLEEFIVPYLSTEAR